MDCHNGAAVSGVVSFADLLDYTCERLWEKKIQISLQRLERLEVLLTGLERELDAFLLQENKPIMNP
jgi:hypothetical protein